MAVQMKIFEIKDFSSEVLNSENFVPKLVRTKPERIPNRSRTDLSVMSPFLHKNNIDMPNSEDQDLAVKGARKFP